MARAKPPQDDPDRMQAIARLRAERKRAGLTQAQMAQVAGVSMRTWQDWERGFAGLGLDSLLRLHARGFDAAYVLTGRRIPSGAPDAEESAFLNHYRASPARVQAAVRALLEAAARGAEAGPGGKGKA